MRNFKKFLSLALAMLTLLSATAFSVSAATPADYSEAAASLAAIGVLKGDENGNLMLDKSVTRYQAALFFVQAITGKTDPTVWNADKSAIFDDVPEYGTAIDYLAGLGIIIGRGDGSYGYNDPLTYQDMLTIAVRVLGYETADLQYPYGHILTAQKLGLTDNLDVVNFRAEMTRGETAQLIWDMLGTEIAMVDPLSGDLIYPGKEDESAYGILLGPGKITRETYLERAGFASGKLVVTVEGFTEAEDKDEVDTVTVNYGGTAYTLRASDLGITAETPKIGYLGLPHTLYVNCAADDFFAKYSVDGESDVKVVLVNTDALTDVQNLADAGNIRVEDGTILLGGVKFASDKYETVVYEFGEDGWKATDGETFAKAFAYTQKDGYVGENSNGAVRYTVRETVADGETVKTLHIYYMPYAFGQYFVRTLKDTTTGKDASFVTLGSYESTRVENADKELSHFVEYLLGTTSRVTSATASVSRRNGEKAKTVKLDGEAVRSGDFVFYYYNSVDNVLTVIENHGGFRTGVLTGTSANKETVKIGGTNYGFGFKGAMNAPYSTYGANAETVKTAISSVEGGKDNVKFVTVHGNVVYLAAYKGESTSESHDFAIVSLNPALLSDLLGVREEKLQYTAGLVLDGEGRVAVAVLNTESGKWELGSIASFGIDYDAEDGEYATVGDLGEYAKYVDIAGESFSKYAEFTALKNALGKGGVFALVEENDGVMHLGEAEGAVKYASVAEGLQFSDVTNKTNKIKADPEAEAVRVSLDDATVTVIVDGEGNVGVRRGVQKAKYSVNGEASFYAASAKLLVAVVDSPVFAGGFSSVTAWGESLAENSTETYYVATDSSELSVEANGELAEKKYTVTVTDLLDLRTLTVVAERSFLTDSAVSIDLSGALYADAHGVISNAGMSIADAFAAAVQLNGAEKDEIFVSVDASNLAFIDGDTVTVNGGALTLPSVLAGVNATVVTMDKTGLDREDYDFDRLAVNVEYDAENGLGGSELEITDGVSGYEYPLYGDTVEVITEPTDGVLNQFILNANGAELLLPLAEEKGYDGAASISVNLKIMANYNEDTGILTLFVAKILSK